MIPRAAYRLAIALLCFCAAYQAQAQRSAMTWRSVSLEQSCAFDGKEDGSIWVRPASAGAQQAIQTISGYSGLRARFEAYATGDIGNAAAVVYEGQRYVLYNPAFVRAIESRAGTYWASVGILAHEIGHHLAAHTLDGRGSYHAAELEADYFAGFILYKMGASEREAMSAFAQLSARGSSSHPPRARRLQAVRDGWREAAGQRGRSATPPPPAHDPDMPTLYPYNDTPLSAALEGCYIDSAYETVTVYDAPERFRGGEVSYVLEHESGDRYQYQLDTSRMNNHQLGWTPTVMQPGRRLRVRSAACGAAGRFIYLYEVLPLPPR